MDDTTEKITVDERSTQRNKPGFNFAAAISNMLERVSRTVKRQSALISFDPNATMPGMRDGHRGQFAKSVAKRRRRNKIARRSRRVNQMVSR